MSVPRLPLKWRPLTDYWLPGFLTGVAVMFLIMFGVAGWRWP